jgi:hypothetical protein
MLNYVLCGLLHSTAVPLQMPRINIIHNTAVPVLSVDCRGRGEALGLELEKGGGRSQSQVARKPIIQVFLCCGMVLNYAALYPARSCTVSPAAAARTVC